MNYCLIEQPFLKIGTYEKRITGWNVIQSIKLIFRPPRGIIPYYNMTESIISRETCKFLLTNQIGKRYAFKK